MSEAKENMHRSVPVSLSIFSGKQNPPEQLDTHKQHWSVLREELALGVNSWGTAPWFPKLAHSSGDRQNQAASVSSIYRPCHTVLNLLFWGLPTYPLHPASFWEECDLCSTIVREKLSREGLDVHTLTDVWHVHISVHLRKEISVWNTKVCSPLKIMKKNACCSKLRSRISISGCDGEQCSIFLVFVNLNRYNFTAVYHLSLQNVYTFCLTPML